MLVAEQNAKTVMNFMLGVDEMQNELISIIIPAYNVGEFIEICLDSLLNQTHKNLEIIVIDDGSDDNTAVICDEFASKDKRVKVIHTKNCGVSHARNTGLDNAHGDYIGFVDADDWVDEDTYEQLLHEIIENNADVAGGGYIREEENGGYITFKKGSAAVYSRDEILQKIFSCDVPKLLYWELCDKLFKKELVTNIRFDESIGTAEDKLFFWQAMKNVNKFAYVPLFKYHYRMRQGSAVHSGITDKTISSLKAERYIWEMSREEDGNLRNVMFANYVSNLLGCTRQMLVYDVEKYENDIKKNQAEIRENFFELILLSNLTKRMFMAVIYLSMPLRLCILLKRMILKESDILN